MQTEVELLPEQRAKVRRRLKRAYWIIDGWRSETEWLLANLPPDLTELYEEPLRLLGTFLTEEVDKRASEMRGKRASQRQDTGPAAPSRPPPAASRPSVSPCG